MVVHSYFPSDPRVRKEALALQAAGHDVDVICLRRRGEDPSGEFRGIRVRRMSVSRQRSAGPVGYLIEYLRFFTGAFLALERLSDLDVVHVHNIPDELVYCAAAHKARGRRIVLDLHDPMPELFVDKYGLPEDGRVHSWLGRLQMASCRFADHVIVSSELMRDLLVSRGLAENRVSVVINGPEPMGEGCPYVVVYHGSVFERYGLDTVLEGLARARETVPEARLFVFASDVDPACLARLEGLAGELGISDRVAFSGPIAPAAVRHGLATADLGVVPARRSSHIDLVYPTKLFECLSAGLPVLAARTPPLERAFGESLDYYEPGDVDGFAEQLALLAGRRNLDGRYRRPGSLPEHLAWDHIASTVVEAITGVQARSGHRRRVLSRDMGGSSAPSGPAGSGMSESGDGRQLTRRCGA